MRGEPVHSTPMTLLGRRGSKSPSLKRGGVNPSYPAQVSAPSLDSSWGVGEVSTQFGLPSPLPLVPTFNKGGV